jgi:hypothetical protein
LVRYLPLPLLLKVPGVPVLLTELQPVALDAHV